MGWPESIESYLFESDSAIYYAVNQSTRKASIDLSEL